MSSIVEFSEMTSTERALCEAIYGPLFSDGVDGSAILDGVNTVTWAVKVGNVYTATRDAYHDDLKTTPIVTLFMQNFRGPYVRGLFRNEGITHNDGKDAIGAAGGASTAAGTLGATFAGGAGGTGVGVAGTGHTSGIVPLTNPALYSGGDGGAGTSAGGAGGQVSALVATRGSIRGGPPMLTGITISQLGASAPGYGGSGGGGGGDGVNSGGGGGAGASAIFCGGGRCENAGVLRCRGGNGAAGVAGNSGGGGGGGGGHFNGVFGSFDGDLPIVDAGEGGALSGTGIVGASGLQGSINLGYPVKR